MKKWCTSLAIALVVLVAVGCKSGNQIVGTWEGQQGGATASFTFNADNTCKMEVKAGPLTSSSTGTYKLEGEKLTMTATDIKVTPKEFEALAKGAVGKSETVTVRFLSDTELEMGGTASTPGGPGAKTILKKKKS